MPSIGIDATFVRPGLVGGAEQMLEGVTEGLAAALGPDDRLLVFGDVRHAVSRAEPVAYETGRNRFLSSWQIRRRFGPGLDAMLFPNYFTPPARNGPRVVTVMHDLQYRHHPRNFSRRKRAWLRLAHETTLRFADVVVAVSEFVRRDLLSAYGSRHERKVRVIHNPIAWHRLPAPESRQGNATRCILTVSAQYPHKNLATLLQAFARLRARPSYEDVELIVAGQWSARLIGIARRPDLQTLAARLGLGAAVRFTGYVADAELAALYARASAFAFPSVFEGFGMPAVEALGVGLPVLTTRCAALPETTAGLATYVDDPLDAAEMADKLAAILDAPERFRPAETAVSELRERYSVQRIGRAYYDALVAG